VQGRGIHSFPFQLNLSSSVHRVTHPPHDCVLELLKLSSNMNECKPLVQDRGSAGGSGRACLRHRVPRAARIYGRGLHSSTFRLIVSAFCWIGGALKGCLGGVQEVSGVMRGVSGV
jgi:hypothetical protein